MLSFSTLQQTAIILALAGLTACAGGPKKGGPYSGQNNQFTGVTAHPVGLYFVGLDRDGDGVTNRGELAAGIKNDWKMFDGNPSAAKFQTWTTKALGSSGALPSFLSFDTNLDGVVTISEFETRLTGEFNRLDRNSDERLSRDELVFTVESRRREDRSLSPLDDELDQRGGRPPR